jgi:mRNA interferase MazF
MRAKPPIRGQIYRADIGFGAKPWLIVSNNPRNAALGDLLAVRVTTTSTHARLPTWIPLTTSDPLTGWIVCDDLQQLARDELTDYLGALSAATTRRVNAGLRIALAIP